MAASAKPRTSRSPALAALVLVAIALSVSQAGCAGIINNNPELRWMLFSTFGAPKVCPEMLKHGVSVRLADRAPAIGRFFPQQCSYTTDGSRQVLTVSLAGTGYGFITPAKRIGFSLNATVEYRPDFVIAGNDIYVWAKLNRIIDGPRFQLGYVENPIVDVATNVPGIGSLTNLLGNQVVSSVMSQGFTVIHNEDKGDDFTLGNLYPPSRPHHPFQVVGTDRYTFANETVDVQSGQRDYLGPFEITSSGQALYLTMSLVGAPVDVMIVDKLSGDLWRNQYQSGAPLGPPPGLVVGGAPLQPGAAQNTRYALQPGSYYVVIDNTAFAGTVNPTVSFLGALSGGSAAQVSYVAQLAN